MIPQGFPFSIISEEAECNNQWHSVRFQKWSLLWSVKDKGVCLKDLGFSSDLHAMSIAENQSAPVISFLCVCVNFSWSWSGFGAFMWIFHKCWMISDCVLLTWTQIKWNKKDLSNTAPATHLDSFLCFTYSLTVFYVSLWTIIFHQVLAILNRHFFLNLIEIEIVQLCGIH